MACSSAGSELTVICMYRVQEAAVLRCALLVCLGTDASKQGRCPRGVVFRLQVTALMRTICRLGARPLCSWLRDKCRESADEPQQCHAGPRLVGHVYVLSQAQEKRRTACSGQFPGGSYTEMCWLQEFMDQQAASGVDSPSRSMESQQDWSEGSGEPEQESEVSRMMPYQSVLVAAGRTDLDKAIKRAGGYMDVAHALGWAAFRKPRGEPWLRPSKGNALLQVGGRLGWGVPESDQLSQQDSLLRCMGPLLSRL